MPADERVVSNTSPLLNLALIDRLDLVEQQFSTVSVPGHVWEECLAGEDGRDELERYHDMGVIEIVSITETDLFREFQRELDRGEAAVLAFAIEVDADLCLLDEREARAAAIRHDIDRTGVIGILLRGVRTGDVDLRSELDALRAAGFWIGDDLYGRVLDRGSTFDHLTPSWKPIRIDDWRVSMEHTVDHDLSKGTHPRSGTSQQGRLGRAITALSVPGQWLLSLSLWIGFGVIRLLPMVVWEFGLVLAMATHMTVAEPTPTA